MRVCTAPSGCRFKEPISLTVICGYSKETANRCFFTDSAVLGFLSKIIDLNSVQFQRSNGF